MLAQEFPDFELIIVDDASTDATAQVIKGYDDPRIILVRQSERRGGGAARNRGAREARSSLISFLDSDDAFLRHKLGFVVDYFARHPDIDVLLDSFEIVYPPEKRRRNSHARQSAVDRQPQDRRRHLCPSHLQGDAGADVRAATHCGLRDSSTRGCRAARISISSCG